MVIAATELEIALSEATGKSVLAIRYATVRMLLELQLGRQLTQEEAKRFVSKVSNSYPRLRHSRLIYRREKPEPDHLGALEILRIIERTGILEAAR